MKTHNYFLNHWDLLAGFFPEESMKKWKKRYTSKAKEIEHDEPWLTLLAIYSIFSDKKSWHEEKRLKAFNQLIANCGLTTIPTITDIIEIKLENQTQEILDYRERMKKIAFHHYPDITKRINKKKEKETASFEGNTNVDLFIKAKAEDQEIDFYIEAKFESDISYHIQYNPVRDQIIRNIDSAIGNRPEKTEKYEFPDFYFLLLSPKIFRTDSFGGNRITAIDSFQPKKSRLYCYKMDEYKLFQNIKDALPHRAWVSDEVFKRIANQIGWITFEDMYKVALDNKTMKSNEEEMIRQFMDERNMIE